MSGQGEVLSLILSVSSLHRVGRQNKSLFLLKTKDDFQAQSISNAGLKKENKTEELGPISLLLIIFIITDRVNSMDYSSAVMMIQANERFICHYGYVAMLPTLRVGKVDSGAIQ
ncbi:hypothetical protein DUI87_07448 [Hirundo rustica rustica]|uniref:Uncharacterized protein n=1 Tax=Hirundo rustica rustica TaxID=333673 RepID=A0A3M0KWV3_HIRRU|nr:hypothetical protein DUI87_07448 [Hirundo rustica rustica]